MSKLSAHNREALLEGLNQEVAKTAKSFVTAIMQDSYRDLEFYPPNIHLSEEELSRLAKLKDIPGIEDVLIKVFSNSSSTVLFELLNWIDGTGDPSDTEWTGVNLVDASEDYEEGEMLHDGFLDAST